MADIEAPVLIVGGGPIGLALAADLGRRGVRTLLVEERENKLLPAKMLEVSVAHHGVLPPARHRRTGPQLGLSAAYSAR